MAATSSTSLDSSKRTDRVWVTTPGSLKVRKMSACFLVPIGTPLSRVLEYCGGLHAATREVILGGPMMGAAASNLDIPITKGTSGVVAFTDIAAERTHSKVYPCIRCGYCVDACPMRALDFGDYEELQTKYGASDHIYPLPDHSITGPSLCIKAHPNANKPYPEVSNIEEVKIA